MALLEIRKYPDEVLLKRAREIENIDGDIVRLAQDMLDTMYEAPGVGLAAPQIGQSLRLIVFDIDREKGDPRILINPVITATEGEEVQEEGCLSLPGLYAKVKRARAIEVRGYDVDGKEVLMQVDGLMARVIQHEVDHLDGHLFIDRVGRLRRQMLIKRYMKMHS